jgi:hypothetical protein
MQDTVTRSGVATATDGPLRPAVSATGPRTMAVRAVKGLAMTTEGRRMQQGLAPRAAEGLVLAIVKAPALHVLPSRILPQIEPISGRKHTELNRQTRDIERLVSHRKQTAATCSNRQKIKKWSVTFLPEVAQSRMLSFSLCTQHAILPNGGSL